MARRRRRCVSVSDRSSDSRGASRLGALALRHGSRGRPSPRRLADAVREQIAHLMKTVYVGFNDTHLTEKLRESARAEIRVHVVLLARAVDRRALMAPIRP